MSPIVANLLMSTATEIPEWAAGYRQASRVTARSLSSHRPQGTRRTRIWNIPEFFHCSIIGTCLSAGDARRLLIRLRVEGSESGSDHEIHSKAVCIAQIPSDQAKYLHKALDRRHQTTINQFAKAESVEALDTLWQRALQQGDIPGAYWALLTHPSTSEVLAKKAFADIHMLSHLVGAANRADIRRLRQLEQENAALAAKLDRQQRQIRDGFKDRDSAIFRLREALSQTLVKNGEDVTACQDGDTSALSDTIVGLKKTLVRETAHRERLERRLVAISNALEASENTRRNAESRCSELTVQLATLEDRINLLFKPDGGDTASALDLHGVTLLYAGGRKSEVPRLKAFVDRVAGRFLYHDGGIEDAPALLPGLVSQSDVVFFPVDCVSHAAATLIKRLSHQAGKRYVPLRTSSLTCLISALSTLPLTSFAPETAE